MNDLSCIPLWLLNASTHQLIVGGVLFVLLTLFVCRFLPPACWHIFRLWRIAKELQKIPKELTPEETLAAIETIFSRHHRRLRHLWNEYQETLHRQCEERDGELHTKAVRATVPAELYFNGQALVEDWLDTELYKHLPGIFTGLGIIGTFSGLIIGLAAFHVSENPGKARESLQALMHTVSEAFLVSAGAIITAMVVTFLEKSLVAILLRKAEAIARALDERFDSGVGEEYLSRLVKASEESASQARILKDALVGELKVMLTNLTDSQIQSNQQLHHALVRELNSNFQGQANSISESIRESLQQPLQDIAKTVQSASGEQGEAAVLMLQWVMERFGADLQTLLGGQINGLQGLNDQAAQAMENAVTSLNTLVNALTASGQQSAKDMAARMASAVADMKTELSGISGAMRQAVEAITAQVGASQEETDRKLQETLGKIDVTLSALLEKIQVSQAGMMQEMEKSQGEMAQTLHNAATGITGGMDNMLGKLDATMRGMETSVDRLGGAVTDAINKMDAGAAALNTAAGRFAQAGESVSRAMAQSETVSAHFGKASDDVLTATHMLDNVSAQLGQTSQSVAASLADYQNQRNLVVQVLEDLKTTIGQAKQEASLTENILRRMEGSAAKLATAQKNMDEYLEKVSAVLSTSSNAFRTSVTDTLKQVNHEFLNHLETAVKMLNTSIQELEVTVVGAQAGRSPSTTSPVSSSAVTSTGMRRR
ncbi:MAG: anti-phage defense ZorAB system protein ZorA [Desulfobulbus sp.]|nr:anti-phage defense ZorAB system protein ZorA [Desulfobulbus sp.]